jgi:GNAT superfamily N-acetyltransferase
VIIFTPATVTDAVSHDLLTEYFAFRAAGFPGPGEYSTTFPSAHDFEPPAGVFLVASDDGSELGCGGIRRLSATRYEVKHLWVRPVAQGRGIGRALLAELERRARDLGATEVVLDTNESLRAAGALYRSSGYEPIAPYNDNPNANVWLRKSLGGSVPAQNG